MKKLKRDVIGYWSEIKLEIVREYASAYSRILSKQRSIRNYSYVDAFAGAGQHISKRTGEFVPGSPLNALLVKPPFGEFHLIDLDGTRAVELREMVGERKDVIVYEEDAKPTERSADSLGTLKQRLIMKRLQMHFEKGLGRLPALGRLPNRFR